jgi:hydroxymethylpyrimidine/phosphomethylpyrimidine kinase
MEAVTITPKAKVISGMPKRFPRLLTIAGSDSSGGAGIQADIKTAAALGAYAMTAITAITVQDTQGVHAVQLMPPGLVRSQMRACLDDIGADVIKIGMLGSADIALTVIDVLRKHALSIPVVLDTVLLSTSCTPLLDDAGIRVLREEFIPYSTIVTPNMPEAEFLTGIACNDLEGVKRAGLALNGRGAKAVLVKGGHAQSTMLTDIYVEFRRVTEFSHPRQDTPHTHGTGCTYATAIAVGMASGRTTMEAVRQAHDYVQRAIAAAPGIGRGRGPLNHMHTLDR